MFRDLLAILLLVAALPAQVIQIANTSSGPFQGWRRTTMDWDMPAAAIEAAGVLAVKGPAAGKGLWIVDVRADLKPGDMRRVDLRTGAKRAWALPPISPESISQFGTPQLAGRPLSVRGVTPEGAGYLVHFSGRLGGLGHADLWLKHYPDAPGIAAGELVICASNPAVPDLEWAAPADLTLRFGEAAVLVPGKARGALIEEGDLLADGQARSWPLVAVWPRLLKDFEWSSAGAIAAMQVPVRGVANVWPIGGTPAIDLPDSWLGMHLSREVANLHGWGAGLGVAPASGVTGAQEDQLFVGGEAKLLGNELPRYLAALGQSRRPCHHLELDGTLLTPEKHPRLRMWEGRAHWHLGQSPDQLGKPRALQRSQTQGWWGPDEEHRLYNSVAVGYWLTGSPALQWQLRHAATHLLFEVPNRVPRARAIGYRGLLTALLDRVLEDRPLAARVRVGWELTVLRDLSPKLSDRGGVWDRFEDPRLGPGTRWMPWQAAVGAYGLWISGYYLSIPDATRLGEEAARAVVEQGYVQVDGDWKVYYTVPLGVGESTFGSSDWADFGSPLALAVLKRARRTTPRVEELWARTVARGSGKWTDPGVR